MSLFNSAENAIFSYPKDTANQPSTQGVADLFKHVAWSFDSYTELAADTTMSYSAGSAQEVSADEYVYVQEYVYKIASSGATDHHVTTAGGVKLYVMPINGWVNLLAFGADGTTATRKGVGQGSEFATIGDDQYPYIKTALDYCIDNDVNLYVPAGEYRMDTRYEKNIPTATVDMTFSMKGDGTRNTNFIVNGDANSNGAFKFTMTTANSYMFIKLEDFSIQAGSATNTQFQTCGRAIHIERNPAPGLRSHPEVILRDLETVSVNNDEGYFNNDQIYLEGLHWVRAYNCRFQHLFAAKIDDASNAGQDDWISYQASYVIHLSDCYGPVFEDCMFRGGSTAVYLNTGTEGQGGEGGTFRGCVANNCKIGVEIDGANNEPGFIWRGDHINARDVCLNIKAGKFIEVSNTLFYIQDDLAGADGTSTPRCIGLASGFTGDEIKIFDNKFTFLDHDSSSNTRFIWDASTTSDKTFHIHNNLILDGNDLDYGFFSAQKNFVYAWGNNFNHASSGAYYNGGNTGYQFEQPVGDRRQIYGYGSPNTVVGNSTISGSLSTKDKYQDMNSTTTMGLYYWTSGSSWTLIA